MLSTAHSVPSVLRLSPWSLPATWGGHRATSERPVGQGTEASAHKRGLSPPGGGRPSWNPTPASPGIKHGGLGRNPGPEPLRRSLSQCSGPSDNC